MQCGECFALDNANEYREFYEYSIFAKVEGNEDREREDRKCAGQAG